MYILKQADFITETTPMYSDPEGDSPYKILIESLPTSGVLELRNVEVTAGQVLDYTLDVGSDELVFFPDTSITTAHSSSFTFRASDIGSERWSNLGTITFNIKEQHSAPTVDNNSGNLTSKVFTFGVGSFTNNFTDADGDSYHEVTIESLPLVPQLQLLGVNVSVGTKFLAINSSGLKFNLPDRYAIYNGVLYQFTDSLDTIIANYDDIGYKLTENTAGKLTFTNEQDDTDVVNIQGTVVPNSSLQFTFSVTDNSTLNTSSNIATFSLIPVGNVNIKPVYVNNPPIVGDNRISLYYNEIRTFTQAHFVEATTPPYYDPETDAPYELKVLTLPQYGQLFLSSSPVAVNQIISFEDIRAGLFKYGADSTRTDITYTSFEFAVSDIGSKQFSE